MNHLTDRTKDAILSMSKDFDEKNGSVTCEMSITWDTIDEFEQFIKGNTNILFGRWILMTCGTCVEHNGLDYIHASIEKFSEVEKMEKALNHIKTI